MRSDRGGEFTPSAFERFIKEKGIEHVLVPPGAHAQNGRVERAHLTILNGIRTLLVETGLPASLWGEAAKYIAFSRNCSFGTNKTIPFESWYGKRLQFIRLHAFGEKVFFRDHTNTNKLQPRYHRGRFMGYASDSSTSSYRVLDMADMKIKVSRDIITLKKLDLPQPRMPARGNLPFGEENKHQRSYSEDPMAELPDSINTAPEPAEGARQQDNMEHAEEAPPVEQPQSPIELLRRLARHDLAQHPPPQIPPSPTPSQGTSSDASSIDPLALTDNPETWGTIATALNAMSTDTPNTYREAIQSGEGEQWHQAMMEELEKMEKYKVWKVVDREPGQRALKARWVYTRKIDGTTGKPAAYKARWVAKGFSQKAGIDCNEVFSAVAHKDSIRVFLSLVNHLDMECDQVDIKAAFLNGDLEETIYLEAPEGSDIPANKILLLNKSLYGLRQSPRCFNKALDQWLKSQGLKPTRADPCFYVRCREGELLMLSVHVDDQLIACNSRKALDEFKQALNSKFECSDSGPAGYFLGINIYQDRPQKKLYLSQEHYMESLLDRFDMSNCNPAKTPLPSGFKPIPATDQEHELAQHRPYPKLVGSILYAATVTRPDLAHAAGVLSRFISKWNESHWLAAKHCLRYIRGTSDLSLTFDAHSSKRVALDYVDADWGGDMDTRRSTTGYIFKVYGGTIAWKSKRQPTVALSTTEAEYMASADAAKQAVWLRLLSEDIGLGLGDQALQLVNDNAGAIALSKNPINHEKSKHIDMRHHFIHEKVEDKTVSLAHVPSADNIADLLTKALPTELFTKLCHLLGMKRLDQGGVLE